MVSKNECVCCGVIDLSKLPFSKETARYRGRFLSAGFVYLSLNFFHIEISSLDAVGISIKLPKEALAFSLFCISFFFFLRFALDLMSEMRDTWRWPTSESQRIREFKKQLSDAQPFGRVVDGVTNKFSVRTMYEWSKDYAEKKKFASAGLRNAHILEFMTELKSIYEEKGEESAIVYMEEQRSLLVSSFRRSKWWFISVIWEGTEAKLFYFSIFTFDVLFPFCVFFLVLLDACGALAGFDYNWIQSKW